MERMLWGNKLSFDKTIPKRFEEATGIGYLPPNMMAFMMRQHCNLQANCCLTDAENGYGMRVTKDIRISMPYKKCNRCGYHSLWNPDDSESRCQRHTYSRGWEEVFIYQDGCGLTLEEAFEQFLSEQGDRADSPVKYKQFP